MLAECQLCLGKNELIQLECERCEAFGYLIQAKLNHKSLSKSDKKSNYSLFDQDAEVSALNGEERSFFDKNQGGTLPGMSGDKDNENKKSEFNLINLLKWLLKILMLILFIWRLFNMSEFMRSELKESTEKTKAPVKVKVKKDLQKRKSPRTKGTEYNFDPIDTWKSYGNMEFQTLQKNRGFMSFVEKNLKGKSLKKARKILSEKGIFFVCKDFGTFALDCRDKWFKERKIRQTFVNRVEELFKRNGKNINE